MLINLFRYWELEACETVIPVYIENCLASDCRYREDSIAFGTGDLGFS